jgi:transcriptional regulator with XRE-family HTH domain
MTNQKHPTSIFFRDVFLRMEKERAFKTKTEFSEKLGTFPHIVNEILAGKRSPTVRMISLMAEVYQVSPTYLVIGKGSIYMNREVYADRRSDYPQEHKDLVSQLAFAEKEIQYLKQINGILESKKKK